MQENQSIICARMGYKNSPLMITICHHSASLMMPNGDHQGLFFYPILRLTMSSYINKIIALLEKTTVEATWELGNKLQANSKMALLFAYPDDRFSHVNADPFLYFKR